MSPTEKKKEKGKGSQMMSPTEKKKKAYLIRSPTEENKRKGRRRRNSSLTQ